MPPIARLLKFILIIFFFVLLTVLTQVGGIIYLLSRLTYSRTDKWSERRVVQMAYRFASFIVFYAVASWLVVPALAKPLGRVPLPLSATNHLQPLNVWTCMLNRHYVKPELKLAAYDVARQMNEMHPGTITNYLDANFPFIDRFPLLPHLSHNDGKKLDLSFCYREASSGKASNECPSGIGYGICEEARPDEKNTAAFCSEHGYWQYSFLTKVVPQGRKKQFTFDAERTRELVNLLAQHPAIGKIFIEPHLKSRLKLTSDKIRFHGCQAVRHDDHMHLELK